MRSLLIALSMAVAAVTLGATPLEAQAKRLGAGRPAGMQRQAPAKPAEPHNATPANPSATPGNTAAPAQVAAPAAAGANTAAAAAGKRSWLGPIAGLAAGLGLAALFSHLGMGEGFANIVMLLLLAVVAFVALRWVMSRFASRGQPAGGLQLAGAGAGSAGPAGWSRQEPGGLVAPQPVAPAAGASGAAPSPAAAIPGGMSSEEFERVAKQVFIRLQAANDAGNIDDLRRFTTPELFASLKADLLERGSASQRTDVVQIAARVVDVAEESGQHIVTVRFQGLIREAADAGAEPFDELWHMVRPVNASADWAIAGIAPTQ